jgi:hypothetical protein
MTRKIIGITLLVLFYPVIIGLINILIGYLLTGRSFRDPWPVFIGAAKFTIGLELLYFIVLLPILWWKERSKKKTEAGTAKDE